MVYEAVEAIALRSQLQRRNNSVSVRSHEHQVKATEENELIWGIILWIIRKICPAY